MAVTVISIDELTALCARALERAGASAANALALARQTADSDASGQHSTGVGHLFDYIAGIRDGRINVKAEPNITRPAPAMIHSDAGGGLPQTGFDMAFDNLVAAAKQFGIAMFAQNNAFTCGALGWFAARLAAEGLVSFAATNGPKLIAAGGATKPVYCTNPIAFAAPRADSRPVLIDQSSSSTAFVKLRHMAEAGETIPEGWAVDASGKPTTDAREAVKGALLAFGGARGANIALMVEILGGGVAASNWALDAPSFTSGSECPRTGLFVMALDPKLIDPGFAERLQAQTERLANDYGVHIPGIGKAVARERAGRDGIALDAALLERLREAAGGERAELRH